MTAYSIQDASQFNEAFTKNQNDESDEGYFLVVDIQYTKKLQKLHNDLPLHMRR